jgi:hypothetical protein
MLRRLLLLLLLLLRPLRRPAALQVGFPLWYLMLRLLREISAILGSPCSHDCSQATF